MSKANFKKNDTVFILTGSDKGKSGKVLHVDHKAGRVTVEGVAVRKKTIRRSQAHPNGGREEVPASIDISNVMAEETYQARRAAKKQD